MSDEPPTRSPPEKVTLSTGQELVRRRKKQTPPASAAELRSLDEVAKRHVEPAETRYHTPGDAVPPDIDDPADRRDPTVSEIVLTEDAFQVGDTPPTAATAPERKEPVRDFTSPEDKPRTLDDLMARFPFDGSGQYYIYVERKFPATHEGISCNGRQKSITTTMSYEDFCGEYGGGDYLLKVYGPPAHGGLRDPKTGFVIPKALTKDIRFYVPHSRPGALDPNLNSAFQIAAPEDDMRPQSGFHSASDVTQTLLHRRANSLPDARIVEAHLQHEREMDDRNRREHKEDRDRKRLDDSSAIGAVKDAAAMSVELLRDQLSRANEKIDELTERRSGGGDMGELAKVLEAVKGPDNSREEVTRLRQGYEEQLRNLREQHADRIKDIEDRTRRDRDDAVNRVTRIMDETVARLTRESSDAQQRAVTDVARADQRLSDLERRLTHERDQERELGKREAERVEQMHRRELESIAKDHEREIKDVKEGYETRIQALKDHMDTKSQLLVQTHELTARVEKGTVESELKRSEADVRRLEAEVTRLKTELEKKGNLPKLLDEATKTAEALGMVKESDVATPAEDLDWKQMALKAGIELAKNAPAMLQQITELAGAGARARQGAQQQRALPPGMAQVMPMPPQMMGPVTQPGPVGGWASEESGEQASPMPMPGMMHPAVMPMPIPVPEQQVIQQPMQPMPMHQPQMAEPVMRPTTPSTPPAAQQRTQRPPRQPAPPVEHAALEPATPISQAQPAFKFEDADVLQFVPELEKMLGETVQAGVPPDAHAKNTLDKYPQLRVVAPSLSVETIVGAIQRSGASSPLVRRDGQRFLRQFHQELIRQAS